jgi:hypothetical protein
VGFMTRFRRTGINPAVDDGFISAIKSGRARVVGEVDRLTPRGALLRGGHELTVDSVICATGYRRGLEELVGDLGVLDDRGAPRFADGAPCDPATPGLYFAGFRVALSGSIRVSAKHARRIAEAIAASAESGWLPRRQRQRCAPALLVPRLPSRSHWVSAQRGKQTRQRFARRLPLSADGAARRQPAHLQGPQKSVEWGRRGGRVAGALSRPVSGRAVPGERPRHHGDVARWRPGSGW